MSDFFDLFNYQYFINALIAAVLAAVSCGIIGSYVVSKRMVFIGGGITHSSFGGIGLGYYLGFNPIFGAMIFAVLSGLGIEFFTKRGNLRNDSVIAMLWSFGMALGIIFIYLTPGYAPNLMTYLFGNILTVGTTDLFFLLTLSVFIVIFFSLFFRRILFIAFDESYASSQKVHVNFINYSLMILISLTIVLNIKLVGIILLLSLLTIPQNAAGLFTKNFKTMILLSILFGITGSFSGLIISYYLDIPSGATIIFSLALIYLLLRILVQLISPPREQLNSKNKSN
jgi:zinc transport system permease protein